MLWPAPNVIVGISFLTSQFASKPPDIFTSLGSKPSVESLLLALLITFSLKFKLNE